MIKDNCKKLTGFTLAEIMVVFAIVAVIAGATIGIHKSRTLYIQKFMSYASFTDLKALVEVLIGDGDKSQNTVASKDATVANKETITQVIKSAQQIADELESAAYSVRQDYEYWTSTFVGSGGCFYGQNPAGIILHAGNADSQKATAEAAWNIQYNQYIALVNEYQLKNGSYAPIVVFSFSETCNPPLYNPEYTMYMTPDLNNFYYSSYDFKPITEDSDACPNGTTETVGGQCASCNEANFSELITDSGNYYCCPTGYTYSNSQCTTTPTVKKALPTIGADLCTRTLDMLNTIKVTSCDKTATDSGPFTANNANFVAANGIRYFNFGSNPDYKGDGDINTDTNYDNFIYTIYVDIDGAKGNSILTEDVTKFYVSMSGNIFVPAPDSKMATDASYLKATIRYKENNRYNTVASDLTYKNAACNADGGKGIVVPNVLQTKYSYCNGVTHTPSYTTCQIKNCEVVLSKPGF